MEIPEGGIHTLTARELKRLSSGGPQALIVRRAVDLFAAQIRALSESRARPEVIVVALPIEVIEQVVNAQGSNKKDEEPEDDGGSDDLNFRDLLKATLLDLPVPTQIVWPDVYDEKAKIPQKIKRSRDRKVQASATRAWNLLNGLYYKSSRVPWRLLPPESEYRTNYLGIGFYRALDGQQLWTSTAQMFDERGRGVILRGARAQTERRGRHPYLDAESIRQLVERSVNTYRRHHRHAPARLVIMKTSRFRSTEIEGIDAALDEVGVELSDSVWVQESSSIMLMREGSYPVLRGTFADFGGRGLLYTRGSVPYYRTYPGQRAPRPLLLVPHPGGDSTIEQIAREVFAMTKVNWNTTQFDQKLPAPIRAARNVGRVLKHVGSERDVQADFRHYT